MFKKFFGQREVKRSLELIVLRAVKEGRPCPPILLEGVSGTGKTYLAQAIGLELGTKVHVANLATGEFDGDILHLDVLNRGDVLVFDEIHAVPPKKCEQLLPFLDAILTMRDGGSAEAMINGEIFRIPPITLVAATTDPGKLLDTVINRFPVRYRLRGYSMGETIEMAGHFGEEMGIVLLDGAKNRFAAASLRHPRTLRNLLLHYRAGMSNPKGVVSEDAARQFLATEGIDPDGLTSDHRDVLMTLKMHHPHALPLHRLSRLANLDERGTRQRVEPQLQQLGYITVASSGRKLTERGLRRASLVRGDQ